MVVRFDVLVTIEEEGIWLFIKDLDPELQVLSIHMTSIDESLRETL